MNTPPPPYYWLYYYSYYYSYYKSSAYYYSYYHSYTIQCRGEPSTSNVIVYSLKTKAPAPPLQPVFSNKKCELCCKPCYVDHTGEPSTSDVIIVYGIVLTCIVVYYVMLCKYEFIQLWIMYIVYPFQEPAENNNKKVAQTNHSLTNATTKQQQITHDYTEMFVVSLLCVRCLCFLLTRNKQTNNSAGAARRWRRQQLLSYLEIP